VPMNTKHALLVVDVQVDMFYEDEAVFGAVELLENLHKVIEKARVSKTPVFFVRNSGGPGQPDEHGTPGWELHPEFYPQPGEFIFNKNHGNAFKETPLQAWLIELGVTHLVLCGLQSEYCIADTCQGALDLGYQVTVVADAHSTLDAGEKTAAEIIVEQNEKFAQIAGIVLVEDLKF